MNAIQAVKEFVQPVVPKASKEGILCVIRELSTDDVDQLIAAGPPGKMDMSQGVLSVETSILADYIIRKLSLQATANGSMVRMMNEAFGVTRERTGGGKMVKSQLATATRAHNSGGKRVSVTRLNLLEFEAR